jgi:hypothetical protein
LDFLDFFFVVPVSELWSLVDCGRAKAGETDSNSSRHTATAQTLILVGIVVMRSFLWGGRRPRLVKSERRTNDSPVFRVS